MSTYEWRENRTLLISDSDLVLGVAYVACAKLILYVSDGADNLKSTLKEGFLRNFFMSILFILRIYAKNLLGGNYRRNIFSYFVVFEMFDVGFLNQNLTSKKLTHYLTQFSFLFIKIF